MAECKKADGAILLEPVLAWSRAFDLNRCATFSVDCVTLLACTRVGGRPGEGALSSAACCWAADRVSLCGLALATVALWGEVDCTPAFEDHVDVRAVGNKTHKQRL